MKFFGQIKRFTSLMFRDVEDGKDITLRFDPNTVYTADRIISLPPGDQNMALMPFPAGGVTANTVPYFSNTLGNLAASATTATELSYLQGSSSAIQTQLGGKEPTITTLAASKGGLATNAGGFSGVVNAASGVFSAATIVNADIASNAEIAGTKINTSFGSQLVQTQGGMSAKVLTLNDGTGLENYIYFNQLSATPQTGTGGFHKLFVNSSKKLSLKDDAGVVTVYGWTMPSYTSTERDALTPSAGMVIYNTTTDRFQGYCAGAVAAWVNLHGWGA